MIDRNTTIEEMGYGPDALSRGSGKKVCAVCDECGKTRWLQFRMYRDLCFGCGQNGDKKIKHICPQCGSDFLAYASQNTTYCSQNCYTESQKVERIENICKQCGKLTFGYGYRKQTVCSWECYLKYFKGENANNWKGGVSSEHHNFYTSLKYSQWRTSIFERDDYTCKECGQHGGNLNAHHILPYRDWKDEQYSLNLMNGITLCEDCHKQTFGKEYDFFGRYFNITIGVDTQ